MKKTVTVNLDKTIFNIDDDAYTVLESYLEALHDHFKKEEGGQEIMNDIESRISELFKERLASITIPDGVTRIGEFAFFCSGLTSVTIPASVTHIGEFAFSGCGALTSRKLR